MAFGAESDDGGHDNADGDRDDDDHGTCRMFMSYCLFWHPDSLWPSQRIVEIPISEAPMYMCHPMCEQFYIGVVGTTFRG